MPEATYGGNSMHMQQQEQQEQEGMQQHVGGRRRSRRRGRGRKGTGGYLMDVIAATGLLGATQLAKRKAGYGFTGKNGYYFSRKRRGSKRGSRRGSRKRR